MTDLSVRKKLATYKPTQKVRIATLSAWILPSAFIEPETSSSHRKCSSRRASVPPGRGICTGAAAESGRAATSARSAHGRFRAWPESACKRGD